VSPPEHLDQRPRSAPVPPAIAQTDAMAGLNPSQRVAVTHAAGPLLVLAGAGSGKTRVITHRVAHLINDVGVEPSRIIAVTFTNKAAAEMRERVERLLRGRGLGSWIGTFHALCLRILRRDGTRVDLAPGFSIYDSDDQLALVRRLLRDESGEGETAAPRAYLSRISRAKNALRSPVDLEREARSPADKLTARLYRHYEESLRRANVVDFDDLLLRTLQLFDDHADVAHRYAARCEHVLVDEYQDTNRPQYLLIRHLTAAHGNICVVGDEDQSIYRFRGAEIRNILEFEADHPGTRTIRLEQNYRSTETIIQAASAVIANNVYRKGKQLWTENPEGEKLELFRAPDDRTEAGWVARRVSGLEASVPYEDMAVLYRTNAQSRLLEEAFRHDRIPYQIVGSVQFYERKEIKDLLAYLKLAANPADDVSFRRVVNTPPRGIGQTTLRAVEELARGTGLPLMEAAGHALEQGLLVRRSATRLQSFLDMIADLVRRADDAGVEEFLERLLVLVDYEAYLNKTYLGQGAERMENVRALISAAAEYTEEGPAPSLQGFLDRSALVSAADEVGGRPGVTLMTVHCAKGLEFPLVFLVGLEERIFPHAMSLGTAEDLEEERRLCYVAMTRAMRRLFLTHAWTRRFQGSLLDSSPSSFIDEVPRELLREVDVTDAALPRAYRPGGAEPRASYGESSAVRAARRLRSQAAARPRGVVAVDGAKPADGFAVGALVRHPRFGGGRILDREGSGKHLKLTIEFSDCGPKKILPAYTKLLVQTG
jgi:DNA helicase-2/ATP-dependent DNA helicase PcrA